MSDVNSPCPVCGYDLKLTDLAAIVESCPCCGFDFQIFHRYKEPFNRFTKDNQRNDLFVRIWRGGWINARMPWRGTDSLPPPGWDPVKQMHAIDVQLGASFEEWAYNNPIVSPENYPRFLGIALEKISQLAWKPEVIEALWDGDTQGWYLILDVSAHNPIQDRPHSKTLFIFNGFDAPTSQIAAFLGGKVSEMLQIPFYFPSPERPNDDYASWWKRNEQKRCIACGRYLHVAAPKMCYSCEHPRKTHKST